jgi:hypothetical protein
MIDHRVAHSTGEAKAGRNLSFEKPESGAPPK